MCAIRPHVISLLYIHSLLISPLALSLIFRISHVFAHFGVVFACYNCGLVVCDLRTKVLLAHVSRRDLSRTGLKSKDRSVQEVVKLNKQKSKSSL